MMQGCVIKIQLFCLIIDWSRSGYPYGSCFRWSFGSKISVGDIGSDAIDVIVCIISKVVNEELAFHYSFFDNVYAFNYAESI